jgi:plasmid maintenance system killer protein
MDVTFRTAKLKKECEVHRNAVRKHGQRMADLIRRRLGELKGAEALEAMRNITGARCHELRANRSGQLSVDLEHPYRLIVEPAEPELSRKDDGGLDWEKVTGVIIVGIEDTHE